MQNESEHPLILFDGDCSLCNGSVQFVIKRDRAARYQFASLQSAAGVSALTAALGPAGIEDLRDSIVLLQRGKIRPRSSAALAIARGIRWPWPLLAARRER